MPKKLPKKEFIRIYSHVPRFCVDLLIKNKKGEILLSKRDIAPDKGWWHLPGGTVLMNERIEEAIQRVAQEELNTKVKIIKLVKLHEYQKSGLGYPIAAVHLVESLGKVKGGAQASEVKYFKTPPRKTLPEVKNIISSLKHP